jgi:hypothetical protein
MLIDLLKWLENWGNKLMPHFDGQWNLVYNYLVEPQAPYGTKMFCYKSKLDIMCKVKAF